MVYPPILEAIVELLSVSLVIFLHMSLLFLFPSARRKMFHFHSGTADFAHHDRHVRDVCGRGMLAYESERAERTGISKQ
ncbi:unnamed protein product [Chondrus crispus]|uniref:Uncharacterized protein n=1 Tax=Chondrus crispus TaxID=2769 RepID=R7QEM2_CHOCR|nr:unnamed protein product [Chondrus crispus]CDF35906.1 unnamed protein product [Chondrus crispus]|eukprot:XP_005715725.1 unnamed protein product [Chondrus crispus]